MNPFDEDYFMRGPETGKSLYRSYSWLPRLTLPMVRRIIDHCGIREGHSVLDFGCARGYVVRAFRELGHVAYGMDISKWAIDNADPTVAKFVCNDTRINGTLDWIIAKDVLEHVPDVQATIDNLMEHARKGVFVVVPLSLLDGQPYIVADYERDITHLHRLCLGTWAGMFMRPGWAITGQYLLPGVKGNYATWERGNGFLTCRRLA